MFLFEDIQATQGILQTGELPELRHVGRTHGISVSWSADVLGRGRFHLRFFFTRSDNAQTLFTEPFSQPDSWKLATGLIGTASMI